MTSIFPGRSRSAVVALAFGLGAGLSLAGQALADPKVLAKVDGQPITDEDVADAMVDIGPGTFPGVNLNAPLVGQRGSWALWFAGAGKGSTTISTPHQCFNLSGQAGCNVSGLRMTAMGGSVWGDGSCLMAHNANISAVDVDFGYRGPASRGASRDRDPAMRLVP